jgi:hypothetical protein
MIYYKNENLKMRLNLFINKYRVICMIKSTAVLMIDIFHYTSAWAKL